MSTAFADITGALNTALNTFSTTENIPVSWENTNYTPAKGTTYLEPRFFPGQPMQAALGSSGENSQSGVYTVNIFAPTGVGIGSAIAIADKLITTFKRGAILTYNRSILLEDGISNLLKEDGGFLLIELYNNVRVKSAGVGNPVNVDDWLMVPVTIMWYSYTAN